MQKMHYASFGLACGVNRNGTHMEEETAISLKRLQELLSRLGNLGTKFLMGFNGLVSASREPGHPSSKLLLVE